MRSKYLAAPKLAAPKLAAPKVAAAAVLAFMTVATIGYAADAPTTPAPSAPAPSAATGAVAGKVNGPDGKPAAGVILRLVLDVKTKPTAADPGGSKKPKVATGTATTNDTGDFKIDNVPPGHYVLTANAKNVGKARSSVVVTEGKTVDITLQLVASKKKV